MDVAPEEPRVFSSKAPLMALLKKVKVARFKVFPTQGEAEVFASQEQTSGVIVTVQDQFYNTGVVIAFST